MALYRHVRNKDDLLDGLVEVILGQIDRPSPGADWKTAAAPAGDGGAAGDAPPSVGAAGHRGPRHGRAARLAYIESLLAIAARRRLLARARPPSLHVLGSRILGFTQDPFDEPGPADPPPERPMLRALAAFPRVAGACGGGQPRGRPGPCDDDVEFAFGLDLILDGLERLHAGFRRPSPRKMAPAVGFEPTTKRLTAARSTTELRRSEGPSGAGRGAVAAPRGG